MQHPYPGETNTLEPHQRDAMRTVTRTVYWKHPMLASVWRLRLLSDPGFPVWDVSYCYGTLTTGEHVRVQLPFDQIPKGKVSRFIVQEAQRDGVYAKGLGILENISTLI